MLSLSEEATKRGSNDQFHKNNNFKKEKISCQLSCLHILFSSGSCLIQQIRL